MHINSGDAIKVKAGFLKNTVMGFALTDFDTDGEPTDFELRRILKDDGIGAVVKYNSAEVKVTKVTDEKYSAEPIEHPEDEEQSNAN